MQSAPAWGEEQNPRRDPERARRRWRRPREGNKDSGTHEAKHVSPKTAKGSRIPSRAGGFSGRRLHDRRYIILRGAGAAAELEAEHKDGMRARIRFRWSLPKNTSQASRRESPRGEFTISRAWLLAISQERS